MSVRYHLDKAAFLFYYTNRIANLRSKQNVKVVQLEYGTLVFQTWIKIQYSY